MRQSKTTPRSISRASAQPQCCNVFVLGGNNLHVIVSSDDGERLLKALQRFVVVPLSATQVKHNII